MTKRWKHWRNKYIKKKYIDQENKIINEFYTLLKFHSNNLMNLRDWTNKKATFIFSALFQLENILEILETFKILKIKGIIFIPKFHVTMIHDYANKLFKNNDWEIKEITAQKAPIRDKYMGKKKKYLVLCIG